MFLSALKNNARLCAVRSYLLLLNFRIFRLSYHDNLDPMSIILLQIATKLHKLTSITAYSYWNAVSLVFMGRDNPDLGKVMCFPLALKIIEKSKEKSSETAEEG